jgi:CRISPR-associated protein Csm1
MSDPLNDEDIKLALMAYAIDSLARLVRQPQAVQTLISNRPDVGLNIEAYRGLLKGKDLEKEEQLTFLLSRLTPKEDDTSTPRYIAARPLNLDENVSEQPAEQDPALWDKFSGEYQELPDNKHRFEAFTNLFYKYAWAVPCTYREVGVSLYEEFKALSALVYASGLATEPAEKFLLVGGDLSGIQKFIYAVTHKAAAKGLRGRSFFLQLLSEAIVRAILQQLALPWTNAVYTAGGNFLILAPDNEETKTHLEKLSAHFNDVLRTATEGDLKVAMGWAEINKEAISQSEAWRAGIKAMSTARRNSKKQPFAKIAREQWDDIFGSMDEGGEHYCVICHQGLKKDEGEALKSEGDKTEWTCELCYSFGELAQTINHEQLWMVVHPARPEGEGRGWSEVLMRLSGCHYEFANDEKRLSPSEQAVVYAFNQTDLLAAKAQGFRLLANVSSRMTPEDVAWAKNKKESGEIAYQGNPTEGHIRDLDVMARDAEGVKWVGVLRMDVDNLGAVISQWQPARALTGTSALSSAMDFFFSGRLREIVEEVATVEKEGEKRLAAYIIYAGGDDLFIVGAWDKLVTLAERIQAEFRRYTGNPNLTISAGISLMDRPKFPLYLAAKQAKEALDDKAKARRWEVEQDENNGPIREKLKENKNAICFLDTVVGWGRWAKVKELQTLLADLVKPDNEKVPRGLIQLILKIHALYEQGQKEYEVKQRQQGKSETEIRNYPMFHGRWMWLAAYQLKRMHRGKEQGIKEALEKIHKIILQPEVTPYSGLAARWVEYLTRGQKEDG